MTKCRFCTLLIHGGSGAWVFKIKKSSRMSRIFSIFLTEMEVCGPRNTFSRFGIFCSSSWRIVSIICTLEPPNPPRMSRNQIIFDMAGRVSLFVMSSANGSSKALLAVLEINLWNYVILLTPKILQRWANILLIQKQCKSLKGSLYVNPKILLYRPSTFELSESWFARLKCYILILQNEQSVISD